MAKITFAAVAKQPSPSTGTAPILRSIRGILKKKNVDIDQYRKHLAAKYR